MFTFVERYEFTWPVKVKYPSAEGEVVKEFTGHFVMPADEMEMYARPEAASADVLVAVVRERLSRYFIGWSGIQTPENKDLPVTEENKQRLLIQRPIRIAVDLALSDALYGEREKN